MRRLAAPVETRASLAWAFIFMGAILFIWVILYAFLRPVAHQSLAMAVNLSADGSTRANKTANRLWLIIKYAPLWTLLGFLVWGWLRAIDESSRRIA